MRRATENRRGTGGEPSAATRPVRVPARFAASWHVRAATARACKTWARGGRRNASHFLLRCRTLHRTYQAPGYIPRQIRRTGSGRRGRARGNGGSGSLSWAPPARRCSAVRTDRNRSRSRRNARGCSSHRRTRCRPCNRAPGRAETRLGTVPYRARNGSRWRAPRRAARTSPSATEDSPPPRCQPSAAGSVIAARGARRACPAESRRSTRKRPDRPCSLPARARRKARFLSCGS
jgi:hypothetical protein